MWRCQQKLNKWQAFALGAILFSGLTVLYFVYPPFGEGIYNVAVTGYALVLGFMTSQQPAWLGMAVGGTLIGLIALFMWKGYVRVRNWGFKQVVAPVFQNSPQYQQPQPILSSVPTQQPLLQSPLGTTLEVKKDA